MSSAYWEKVGNDWLALDSRALWRCHCDAVNARLLRRWLPPQRVERLLKTDLFDEAMGDGLFPHLASHARTVVGLDISRPVVEAVRARHPRLVAIEGDVRRLEFPDDSFDLVVSNSTLDHFASFAELVAGVGELSRVLRRGGELLITLDNLLCPIVGLRNALPFGLLNRLGVVPYYVGASCGPFRLSRVLRKSGFRVLERTAVMHCPRVLAVPLASWLERAGRPRAKALLQTGLLMMERLERLPTRYLTGHFVAARAVKM